MSPTSLLPAQLPTIQCIEMHTSGEPTRIVYEGFPVLTGTLMEQRAQAQNQYDHLRRRILLEPRGHNDMYGAILCRDTELTQSAEADMGVLFMHNQGFSTMCGHATLALGRFLVDNQSNNSILPGGRKLKYDPETESVSVRLHAPCGVVHIAVPTLEGGLRTDSSRPVSFVSVSVFATGLNVTINIDPEFRWPQLGQRSSVTADFSYGGSFYCLITPDELGFPGGLAEVDKTQMSFATKMLKAAANARPELKEYFRHPDSAELGSLYSVMLVDRSFPTSHGAHGPKHAALTNGSCTNGTIDGHLENGHGFSAQSFAFSKSAKVVQPEIPCKGSETGLCFFANQQIDRSPTGGSVAARMALAHAKGVLRIGEKWRYQSLLSFAHGGVGSFVGSLIDEEWVPTKEGQLTRCVHAKVEGNAYYTGHHVFVAEEDDVIGRDGFSLTEIGL